jgi:two-component system CheB/CheR fusion protein
VELRYKELLIGMTNFFRDPGLFDFLREEAVPQLLRERPKGELLRIWNPGCSTGEETYSLSIAIREGMETLGVLERPQVQIFAADIDRDAVEKARMGPFPPSIAVDVFAERLDRFFVHEDGNYRIKKDIRETTIFANRNILVDASFTKVDVLCCRNFLIYINSETQKKVIPLFHYALHLHACCLRQYVGAKTFNRVFRRGRGADCRSLSAGRLPQGSTEFSDQWARKKR